MADDPLGGTAPGAIDPAAPPPPPATPAAGPTNPFAGLDMGKLRDVYTKQQQLLEEQAKGVQQDVEFRRAHPPPTPERIPPAPKNDIRQDAMLWVGFASAIGGLAGARGRNGAMNALNAFSGTLDGLREGNQQKFQNDYKTWEGEAKALQENNKAEWDGYRAIMERQDLDAKQRADLLQIQSRLNRNDFMLQLAQAAEKDPTILAAAMDSITQFSEKGDGALFNLIERRQEIAQQNAQRMQELEYQRGTTLGAAALRGTQTSQADNEAYAQGLADGTIPPTQIPAKSRIQIGADLQRAGVDWSKLQLNWQQANAFVTSQARTGNSPRMIGFIADGNNALGEIERVREAGDYLQQTSPPGINALSLAATLEANGDTEGAKIAQRYVTDLNSLKENLARVMNGGFAPTDSVWQLVNQQLSPNLPVGRLNIVLDELKRLLNIRVNSIQQQLGRGQMATNPYLQGTPVPGTQPLAPPATTAPATTGGGTSTAAPAAGGTGDALARARAAIAAGASRDAVIQRLRENGIDPAGL